MADIASIALSNFFAHLTEQQSLPPMHVLKELLTENIDESFWLSQVEILISNTHIEQSEFLKLIDCKDFVSAYILHTAIYSIYVLYNNKNFNGAMKSIVDASGDTDTIRAFVATCYCLLKDKTVLDNSGVFPNYNKHLPYFWSTLLLKNIIAWPTVIIHVFARLFK